MWLHFMAELWIYRSCNVNISLNTETDLFCQQLRKYFRVACRAINWTHRINKVYITAKSIEIYYALTSYVCHKTLRLLAELSQIEYFINQRSNYFLFIFIRVCMSFYVIYAERMTLFSIKEPPFTPIKIKQENTWFREEEDNCKLFVLLFKYIWGNVFICLETLRN